MSARWWGWTIRLGVVLGLTRSVDMKKFSQKGVVLFAGAMAVCAFVLPSVASAASWGPIGGADHVLDSPDFGYTSAIGGGTVSSCTSSSFTAVVLSGADMQIRAASFGGTCTFISPGTGTCLLSAQGTRFPWTATATTTSNIQLEGVHIDIRFLQTGTSTCAAGAVGLNQTVTGNLAGGNYTGVGRLDFNNAEGLVSHSALGNGSPMTIRASLSDTAAVKLTVS
jgi:hypothetical protein